MIGSILFFIHYALLLLFGICLSAAFVGVRPTKKNSAILFTFFIFCGLVQLLCLFLFSEDFVWNIYPLIAHLPVAILLLTYYRKRISSVLAAVATAYLCCQPAKWFEILAEHLTDNDVVSEIVSILILIVTIVLILRFVTSYIAEIYSKETRNILIFAIIPFVYYIFDYSMGVYTDLLLNRNLIAIEFLPFLLCAVYIVFCAIYYKEYEQKTNAERKEQMVQIIATQQAKEMSAIRRSEQEIRLLRHDMRHLLNSLAVCLDENDIPTAKKLVERFTHEVENTTVQHYCHNDTINYILSNFAAKCKEARIDFQPTVKIASHPADEILFVAILSNALENAIKAQDELPEECRIIKLRLVLSDGKLLLSVKNPYSREPHFVDGMPVSTKRNHGYGTQSIRYLTERLGGNWQFMAKDGWFILRVAI